LVSINEYDGIINKTINCANNSFKRVVSTKFAKEFYEQCGKVDMLPIGVNTELFKPLDKEKLRI
jgi:3-isopropylmalate dehydratase small subunit